MEKEQTNDKGVTMRKKQFFGIITLIVILSLFFGGIVGTYLGAQSRNDTGITYKIRTFMKIIKTVQDNYVRDVQFEDLIDYAIRGMLSYLDPHTIYLGPDEYKELLVGTKGSFGGLGIQIAVRDGVLTIITPIEGTPAYNAGLLAGDKIAEIEGNSTLGITSHEAVKKLRGKPGTDVTIGIKREGIKEIIHFTITRDIITLKAVPYSGMVDKNIGYIRLSTFSETCSKEFGNAIDSLENIGAKKFIVDLRNNSGGLLKEAINVSDNFIEKGEIVVSTKGRKIGTSREYYAKIPPKYGEFPLIVLVNGGSASASEIVSGAVQDWDRGLILGTKTFGKGSVQQVIPIDYETALKITTAKYYTPSGRCIDNEDNKNLLLTLSLGTTDKGEKKDTTTYYTLRLKRKVYGGGAITPDVVCKLPNISELETKLYQKGIFFNFAVDYTTNHTVKNGFKVNNTMLNTFKNYIREKDMEFTDEEFEQSLDGIMYGLKRNIAMKIGGLKSSYESVLLEDKQVTEALTLLKKSKNREQLFSLIEEK